jgi:hypothetical protein
MMSGHWPSLLMLVHVERGAFWPFKSSNMRRTGREEMDSRYRIFFCATEYTSMPTCSAAGRRPVLENPRNPAFTNGLTALRFSQSDGFWSRNPSKAMAELQQCGAQRKATSSTGRAIAHHQASCRPQRHLLAPRSGCQWRLLLPRVPTV